MKTLFLLLFPALTFSQNADKWKRVAIDHFYKDTIQVVNISSEEMEVKTRNKIFFIPANKNALVCEKTDYFKLIKKD